MRRRTPRAPAPYDAPAALCRGGVVGQGTPSAVRSKAQYASAIPRMSGSASCPTPGTSWTRQPKADWSSLHHRLVFFTLEVSGWNVTCLRMRMKSSGFRFLLVAAGWFVSGALALAHPGHDDGHELTWDFDHLAAHPVATLLCFAVLALAAGAFWQAMRRRSASRSLPVPRK